MVSRIVILVLTLVVLAAGLLARPATGDVASVAQQAAVSIDERSAVDRDVDESSQAQAESVADVQDLLAGGLPVPDPGFSMAAPRAVAQHAQPTPWLAGLQRPPKASSLHA